MEYKKVPFALSGSNPLWNVQGHGFIRQLSLVISCKLDLFLKLLPALNNVFVIFIVAPCISYIHLISTPANAQI